MFDLDAEVRRWRNHAEGKSSLSPREVDELEDHLRARIELELELDGALTTARAFATVSEDVGEPAALSREFARAGQPRWRRLLVAGWAMFAVSWFLPVMVDFSFPFSDGASTIWGWQAFLLTLEWAETPYETISALSNALIVVTLLKIGGTRPPKNRWLTRLVTGAAVLNLYWWVRMLLTDDPDAGSWFARMTVLQIGYWAWAGSFICIAAALWLHAREWASARPERALA